MGVHKEMSCSRNLCFKPAQIKGFCATHYKLEWRSKRGCDLCGPSSPFYKAVNKAAYCSPCFRKSFPDRWKLETERKVINNKTLNGRYSNSKSKAALREIPFLITKEEYSKIIANPCYYCANSLGKPTVSGSGLDRLDSDGGYTLHNVVSCCHVCNMIKSDFLTPEETRAAVSAIKKIRTYVRD